MIKVSVIIPIYNAEKYLKECLNSIINQTLKEIEIICINDCSTDSSIKILEEYAKKDNRIKIFNTEKSSGGPATGRNIGIEKSRGEYIGFIDNDDYVNENFYEELYKTAKKYDADIVNNLNIINYYENGKYNNNWCHIKNYTKKQKLEYEIILNKKDFMKPGKFFLTNYIWNKLYKRSFIIDNNIKFIVFPNIGDDGSDDWTFNIELIINNPIAVCNNTVPYYYRIRETSLYSTHKSIEPICYRAENIINNKLKNIDEEYKRIIISNIVEHIISKLLNDYKYMYEENYYHIHNFLKNKNNIDINEMRNYVYYNYILIKLNDKYETYIIYKNNILDYIKQKEEKMTRLINKMVWWIPIRKYRDKVRNKIIRNLNNYEK
ncbi:glycosyltransferase family 2 protein [uncultured Brachyspira sp.]|uniref:glycosyltransferase family 2 protein n=1 Tax=uncultured Brachyspira sp. TaxID=221953 RepID=UPI002607EFEE|nr:glycosyltransferase family 2 protein [uncultured Brachyspira sp.]